MDVSKRIKRIMTPPIAELVDEADKLRKEGKDVLNFGQGVSGLDTPEAVLNKIAEILKSPFLSKYTPDAGIYELRAEVSEKFRKYNYVMYEPENEIIITVGASSAFLGAIAAIADVGDEIILPAPYYFDHEFTVKLVGCIPLEIPMDENNNYLIDVDFMEKRITKRTKAIVIVSPNNPTGAVLPEKNLREIADFAIKNNLYIISDETYDFLVYDDIPHFSIASIPEVWDRTITIGSFSKAFALAGWRVGYVAAPSEIISEILKVQDATVICAPVISQMAALFALRSNLTFLDYYKKLLKRNRDYVLSRLDEIPDLSYVTPKGAFYVFPKYEIPIKSRDFAFKILNEHNLLVLPGSAFGDFGEYHLRLSFGSQTYEELEEGLNRLQNAFKEIRK